MSDKKFLLILACILLLVSACSSDTPIIKPENSRGELVSAELLATYTAEEATERLHQDIPESFTIDLRPEYGVSLYRVKYYTEGLKGGLDVASGLVVLPEGVSRSPLFCYQHGTITRRDRAPSQGLDQSAEALFGLVMAGRGFIAVLPDLLGLGESETVHPYLYSRSEAYSGIDLLRAATSMAEEQSLQINGQLFISGYSHGGHSAMALFKELEDHPEPDFKVTAAAAPMAGPYSLSGAMVEVMLSDDPYPAPYYLPYLIFSYQEIYSLFEQPSDYLLPPYDVLLPPLFDGNHSGGEIDQVMPVRPKEILRPEIIEAFASNPAHPFRQALKANDLFDWTPKAPVKLIHCEGDDQVTAKNSHIAYQSFLDKGAEVTLIQPDVILNTRFNHGDCVLLAALGMITWFDELKE